jgi:late competence protein required for DNA uptake (superfamily II DNA/RNA helicase)
VHARGQVDQLVVDEVDAFCFHDAFQWVVFDAFCEGG